MSAYQIRDVEIIGYIDCPSQRQLPYILQHTTGAARRPRSHYADPCLICWVELRSGPIYRQQNDSMLHPYSSQQLLIDLFTKPFHPSSLSFDIPLHSFICGNNSHFQLFLISACAKDVVDFITKLYCDLEQQVPQKEPPEARRRNHRRGERNREI